MNRLQLYRILYKHRSLSMRRALDYERNRSAKYLFYIGYAMVFAYLLFIAVILSLSVNKMRDANAVGITVGILPFILLVDLFIRFTYQQTPAQIIKCYALLPLPRKVCIESFIGVSLFNLGNAWWYVLFVPYCVMSVVFSYGLLATILLLVFIGLTILLNSQLYVLFRTLISQSLLWIFGLLATYGLLAVPMFLGGNGSVTSSLFIYSRLGIALSQGETWPLLIVLSLLIALVWLNREVQFRSIWRELTSAKAETKVDGKDRLAFLGQHGEIGEYTRLEWKLISRNKYPRKTFIYSFFLIALLSVIIAFTQAYNGDGMVRFWCSYNFVILALSVLSRLLSMEGNYVDMLMVHPNSIYSLLRAKYYVYCGLLIVPFMLMLPMVFVGKASLLMLLGFALFAAGFQFFVFFQSAVYNKRTQKLNATIMASRNMERNYLYMIVTILALFSPMAFVGLLTIFCSPAVSYICLGVVGIIGIATHRLWIRNVYVRMMARRYENMEGFRTSK
ncbi:DUF5687 family protein [Hoylesella loescheii]|uniref:DUF5687 family protein n=1 Tax=Hoylesella loescheii TaxID=840 RepID=UPI00248EAB6C|nr:DUF5687 family protein [Hoylesella loescheii]